MPHQNLIIPFWVFSQNINTGIWDWSRVSAKQQSDRNAKLTTSVKISERVKKIIEKLSDKETFQWLRLSLRRNHNESNRVHYLPFPFKESRVVCENKATVIDRNCTVRWLQCHRDRESANARETYPRALNFCQFSCRSWLTQTFIRVGHFLIRRPRNIPEISRQNWKVHSGVQGVGKFIQFAGIR